MPRPLSAQDLPPYEDLCQRVRYDPDSGEFTRVARGPGIKKKVGFIGSGGYIRLIVNGRNYSAHRLAWLLTTGKWPVDEIDHINGIRSDNRFCNLREASRRQNSCNCRRPIGRSKYRGVTWINSHKRWVVTVNDETGRRRHIGRFVDEVEAAKAYDAAAREIHGEFARLNFPEELTDSTEAPVICQESGAST